MFLLGELLVLDIHSDVEACRQLKMDVAFVWGYEVLGPKSGEPCQGSVG